jgi:calcineurin-like phosphoesterase family protein
VYIAGDFAWRGGYENALAIIKRLKGIKHLAVGNHDRDFLKKDEYRSLFVEIEQIITISNHNGFTEGKAVICHYPMLSWNGSRRGSWHIYGHVHNNILRESIAHGALSKMDKALNAGVDICQYMPVTFQELIAYNEAWKQR